ncbi:hypothetical protein UFOVP1604_3 [uncultured Caudovirales phage]|uniref:Uncharacterized protein n=1 Tax=uncultured Caudovirales phage TaxID=2100421 RepID=A0A6J5STR2_9CAUD|nr:hypothetical protein UFOVP1604_3 [uncultured Caudovirales phage]
MHNQVSNETPSKIGKFNLLTVNRDQHSAQYLSVDSEYICLIPFTKTAEDTIKSIYALEFPNKSNGQTAHTLIIDEVNSDLDRTPYDSVCRALVEEAGLNIEQLGLTENQIFYLGDIAMNSPITLTMHCYGIDLGKPAKDGFEFTRNLSKDNFTKDDSKIINIGFHQVVNGDFPDTTILSGSFLLASYFN